MIEPSKIIDIKKFKTLMKIYQGSQSAILIVKEIETNKKFVAKIFRDEFAENSPELIKLVSQISSILNLSHPAIHQYKGFSYTDFNQERRPVIISKYMKKGSLFDVIDQEFRGTAPHEWNFTKKLINIFGIASGMKYLHSQNIIHRDLKPENILEDKSYYPKISDFNNSLFKNNIKISEKPGMCGTPLFMAPEVISMGKEYEPSFPSDVYSFGMTVFMLLGGEIPDSFRKQNLYEKVINGERPTFNEQIPEIYRKLIQKCWSQSPTDRPTFTEIVDQLKTDEGFLTDEVDIDEYRSYIRMIEEYQTSNDSSDDDDDDDTDGDFEEGQEDYFKQLLEDLGISEDVKLKKPFLISNIKYLNLKNFEKKEKIGVGYFGEVFKITSKSNGSIYAAKVLKDEILGENEGTSIAINLDREVKILSELSHPSIMKFYGYSSTDFINLYRPVLVTEYLKNGTLEDIIEIERNGLKISFFDETMKFIGIYGVARAMSFLHSKDILHRDLKPVNVLLNEYLFPKLSDFGFAKHITDLPDTESFNKQLSRSKVMGTCGFIAPEIWLNKMYTKAGDVYAFAMFVYEMLTFKFPFYGLIDIQICQLVLNKKERPHLTNNIPPCYKKLIQDCWSQEPSKRPTFDQIINRLETEENFMKNIDKTIFKNYIKYIEFEEQQQQQQQTASNKPSQHFQKYELGPIYTEFKESKSMFLEEGFLKIDEFFNQSEIYQNDFSCFYDVVNKKTGQTFSAEISKYSNLIHDKKEKENLSIEVGILSKLNHPVIQKIVGYSMTDFEHQPNPVIIREQLPKQSLFEFLEKERNGAKNQLWTDTKKLINIYGIASGMSYLHSHNVIHHELNTHNIFLDEKLNPKINEFGFFIKPKNSMQATSHSMAKSEKIPYFVAPEILELKQEEATKSSDVYSFGFVAFEIITNEIPFKNIKDFNAFFSKVIQKGSRPSLEKVPQNYRQLISECWSNEPKERPNFKTIVSNLRTNKEFITEKIIKDEYQRYIDFIDGKVAYENI